jgi:hypothetical protein
MDWELNSSGRLGCLVPLVVLVQNRALPQLRPWWLVDSKDEQYCVREIETIVESNKKLV